MGVLMNLLQKLFSGASAAPEKRYYTFSVKCMRCGEVIQGRIDLDNDLSVEYEQGGDIFYAHKVLIGNDTCFQSINVDLKFTSTRKLIEQHVTGGEFV
jgi:hypothetical protein